MHVLSFGNKLNEEVCRGFISSNLLNPLYLFVRLWWNILVAYLATNFQDLVAKVKNWVALAPVLGAISRHAISLFLPLSLPPPHFFIRSYSQFPMSSPVIMEYKFQTSQSLHLISFPNTSNCILHEVKKKTHYSLTHRPEALSLSPHST